MVLRNLFSGQQWRCREQTCGHGWVRGRGAWDDGESNMEIYTLPYIYIFQYDSGSSNWYSVTIWRSGVWWDEGESFKKEGTYVCLRLIHDDIWQKLEQYYKAIILQLKKK